MKIPGFVFYFLFALLPLLHKCAKSTDRCKFCPYLTTLNAQTSLEKTMKNSKHTSETILFELRLGLCFKIIFERWRLWVGNSLSFIKAKVKKTSNHYYILICEGLAWALIMNYGDYNPWGFLGVGSQWLPFSSPDFMCVLWEWNYLICTAPRRKMGYSSNLRL